MSMVCDHFDGNMVRPNAAGVDVLGLHLSSSRQGCHVQEHTAELSRRKHTKLPA